MFSRHGRRTRTGSPLPLEGPDEDGRVWACSPDGRDVWCQNLGPTEKVAEVMSEWLGSIDFKEGS